MSTHDPKLSFTRAGLRLGPRTFTWDDLAFCGVLALLLALAVWPLYAVRLLPVQDMYSHQAIAQIMHTILNDPHHPLAGMFYLAPPLLRPNMLYPLIGHLLGDWVPIEAVTRFLFATYVVTLPLSLLLLFRTLGGNRWLVLLTIPFVYNAHMALGFVGFMLATPLYFSAVALAFRFLKTPTWARGALLALAILATLLAHAQMYLLLLATLGMVVLLTPATWHSRALLAFAIVPSFVIFLPWFFQYFILEHATGAGVRFESPETGFGASWNPLTTLFSTVTTFINNYFADQHDEFVLLCTVALVIVGRIFGVHASWHQDQDVLARIRARPLEMLTLWLAVLSIVLPTHITNQAIIRERHILLAFLLFVGWLPWPRGPVLRPALTAGLVILQIGYLSGVRQSFETFDRSQRPLLAVMALLPPGTLVGRVPDDNLEPLMTFGALWHLHAYGLTCCGALTRLSFAEFPGTPVQYRPDAQVPERLIYTDFWNDPAALDYDALLVRKGSEISVMPTGQQGFTMIAQNAQWALVRVERPHWRPQLLPAGVP